MNPRALFRFLSQRLVRCGLLAALCLLAACAPAPTAVSGPETTSDTTVPRTVVSTRAALPDTPPVTAEPPEAIQAVLWQLASQFRVSTDQLRLVGWEQVEWPNGCLGIEMRLPCPEARVPGFRVLVAVDGKAYEYRSTLPDAAPYRLLLASGPETAIEDPVLIWEGEEEGICRSLIVAPDGRAAIGVCDGPHVVLPLMEEVNRPRQWADLRAQLAPFAAETPSGSVTLRGQGQEVAGPAWHRAVAAWARLVWRELATGRSGASWGSAMAWHREISERPGTCQFLQVELYGWAYASVAPCEGGDSQDLGQGWLDRAEWEQFDGWLYDRAAVQQEDLDLFSAGVQEMSESEVVALRNWAQEAFGRLAQPPATTPAPTRPGETRAPRAEQMLAGLVYHTGEGLWQVGADGWPVRLLDRPDALPSPDGTQAVYVEEEDLWLADLTTGQRRNLTSTPERVEGHARWWPSRPDVLILGSWPRDADLGPSTGFLTAVQVDGNGYLVLDGDNQSNGLPGPAPDGQTIAYDQGGSAGLYRWDYGPERVDMTAYGLPDTKSMRIGSPAWSPDGRQLAWVVGLGLSEGWRLGILALDTEERTSRLLHVYEPAGVGGWPPAPVWSPDGEWLAYNVWPVADRAAGGLWIIRADGSDEHHIGPGSGPVWSPDGRRLVFTHLVADQETSVQFLETGVWEPRLADLPGASIVVSWIPPTG